METVNTVYGGLSLEDAIAKYDALENEFHRNESDFQDLMREKIIARIREIDGATVLDKKRWRHAYYSAVLPFFVRVRHEETPFRIEEGFYNFVDTGVDIGSNAVFVSRIDPETEKTKYVKVIGARRLISLYHDLDRMGFFEKGKEHIFHLD